MADAPTISHETICCAIYAMPRGSLRTELVKLLRHSHAERLPRARGSATIQPSLRKTLTYDQGTEMALHNDLAKRLRIEIHFCGPRSPWQRGSNDNANGQIREYLPKGANLKSFSDPDLRRIEDSLNIALARFSASELLLKSLPKSRSAILQVLHFKLETAQNAPHVCPSHSLCTTRCALAQSSIPCLHFN